MALEARASTRSACGRSAPERRDQLAVRAAAARLRAEVPERARLAVEVGEELHAWMRLRKGGHLLHVRRIVHAPQAPFRDRVRLVAVRCVQLLVRLPRDA